MFTWNLQYISKTRLSDTLEQLMINSQKGDILIRIHSAIHMPEEAVELAGFIRHIVPRAHIFGTSTSAVISGGRLLHDQCVISVTQMAEGSIRSARIPLTDENGQDPVSPERLCDLVKDAVIETDTALMLAFFPDIYHGIKCFSDLTNEVFPGVRMIGGIVSGNNIDRQSGKNSGFVFDENGWSDKSLLIASLNGPKLEAVGYLASGLQVVGDALTVTKAEGRKIYELDGRNAADVYREAVGDEIRENRSLSFLFPLSYSGKQEIPFIVGCYEDYLLANHSVPVGKKLKRGFIHDRELIADSRRMLGKIETFEKAEMIFGYTCRDRYRLYPDSVKWELSVYENTNISGCLTEGELGSIDGKNVYGNCCFVAAAVGEGDSIQNYNPYVFSNTEALAEDNRALLSYLMNIEERYSRDEASVMAESLQEFVRDCELKLLYSEKERIPNEAAFYMDIRTKGYDRICVIEVLDTLSMRTVFSEQMIEMTHTIFLSRCSSFIADKDYRLYMLDKWKIAIAAPSYMVSLKSFSGDMKLLQKKLFETAENYIAIVPVFCVINGCSAEDLKSVYNKARLEMTQKNNQFYIWGGDEDKLEEESIRERYHMVNVINYALSHDKLIPHFQGVYDNQAGSIHHYESLMRLMDENGDIYYPISFLDVARSYGLLYDDLSFTMIRKVFEIFKDLPDKSVSINLGIRDIKNEELTEYIFGFLATAKYPGNFIFEILENEDVDDYDLVVRFIDNIHKLGALISIDDFGSGYSNLQHVVNIHFDYIKIDGSIVRNCCENHASENLVALISGWKRLSTRDVKIVAEYVENEAIQNKLTEYDIDFSQGYLFSKPAPRID
ncbi:MAG: EAL domain-containing protein [Lachnospiraceae bacterium]|nr:EAL domain-containing protein [Lachnospiraceae bacterium]